MKVEKMIDESTGKEYDQLVMTEKGMNTHYAQEKYRNHWHQSISERQAMIDYLTKHGICPKQPHQLKMSTLRRLVSGYKNR